MYVVELAIVSILICFISCGDDVLLLLVVVVVVAMVSTLLARRGLLLLTSPTGSLMFSLGVVFPPATFSNVAAVDISLSSRTVTGGVRFGKLLGLGLVYCRAVLF